MPKQHEKETEKDMTVKLWKFSWLEVLGLGYALTIYCFALKCHLLSSLTHTTAGSKQ